MGAIKRARYGQVDVKLGMVMGVSAEAGVLYGAHVQESIKRAFGDAGSNLYVSLAFVVVLAFVGGYVLWDPTRTGAALRDGRTGEPAAAATLFRPSTFRTPWCISSLDARVSVLFTIPLGFATGLLAVHDRGGRLHRRAGHALPPRRPRIMASATELVIAFVMGLGGTIKYGWSGLVDIRLAMIILVRLAVRHPARRHRHHLRQDRT